MKPRSLFVKNALTLTVTALLLRAVGIFFRVWLSSRIGPEGMGLYQLILSVYVLIAAFAGAGISTAVTRLVTDELACGRRTAALRILRKAVLISAAVGISSGIAVFFGADLISVYALQDARASTALRVLCFSLPSLGISSCLKGYFSARREAGTASAAQLVEQAVRIGSILLCFTQTGPLSLTAACAVVLAGDTLAEWSACLFLYIGYLRSKRHIPPDTAPEGRRRDTRRLLGIAVPITAGRYLSSALRTGENLLVPSALSRFAASDTVGLSQFGALKGMVLPLLFFPFSFLSAISSLLIPEISEARALHKQHRVHSAVSRALHLTFTSSIWLGTLFTVLAEPLGQLVYHDSYVGFLLRVLAPLTPIMYLESMIDGILKGLGQQTHTLTYSVIDSVVRIVLILVLVPRFGMAGFLFIMVVSNLLTSLLNFFRLIRVTALHVQWSRWIVRPLLAAAFSGVFVSLVYRMVGWQLSELWTVVLGCTAITAVFIAWLIPLGCLTQEDLQGYLIRPVRHK